MRRYQTRDDVNAIVAYDPAYDSLYLYLRRYDYESRKMFVGEITWREAEPGSLAVMSRHAISGEMAQQLVNSLWDAGIRPAQGKGTAGQIEAVQSNLNDLRRWHDMMLVKLLEKIDDPRQPEEERSVLDSPMDGERQAQEPQRGSDC